MNNNQLLNSTHNNNFHPSNQSHCNSYLNRSPKSVKSSYSEVINNYNNFNSNNNKYFNNLLEINNKNNSNFNTLNNNLNTNVNTNLNSNNQNLNDSEILLHIKIKSDKHDDWVKKLKLQIQTNNNNSNITSNSIYNNNGNNSINLKITDSEDPLFLYMSSIGESDFQILKQNQNLFIEYKEFPQKLIEMLELCKEDYLNTNINNNIISGQTGQLHNNNFKPKYHVRICET